MPKQIEIRGARVHNLRNIDVDIPLEKIVGICGVSGAGKSSLTLGVLYAEGSRRYLESLSTYTRRRMTQATRADVDQVLYIPAVLALHQRPGVPDIRSTFGTGTELLKKCREILPAPSSYVAKAGGGQHKIPLETKNPGIRRYRELERVMGVEPTCQPWEGRILPMNYTRRNCPYYNSPRCKFQVLFVEQFFGIKKTKARPSDLRWGGLFPAGPASAAAECVSRGYIPAGERKIRFPDLEEKHLCFQGLQMNWAFFTTKTDEIIERFVHDFCTCQVICKKCEIRH